jgi:hypothetical protein
MCARRRAFDRLQHLACYHGLAPETDSQPWYLLRECLLRAETVVAEETAYHQPKLNLTATRRSIQQTPRVPVVNPIVRDPAPSTRCHRRLDGRLDTHHRVDQVQPIHPQPSQMRQQQSK